MWQGGLEQAVRRADWAKNMHRHYTLDRSPDLRRTYAAITRTSRSLSVRLIVAFLVDGLEQPTDMLIDTGGW